MPIEMTQVITDTIAIAAQVAALQLTANAINADTSEIDDAAVAGLTGVNNSLAYKVHEIERHLHSNERWASKLAVPAGNRVTETGMTPFVVASGAAAYGVAVQIMDTLDCEGLFPGAVNYDLHRLFIADVDHTTPYRIRVSYGVGTQPQAIAAGQYSEIVWRASNLTQDRAPILMQMRRVAAVTKCWIEVWNATNLSGIDIFFGLHFYDG
jgi:hypothetical protein